MVVEAQGIPEIQKDKNELWFDRNISLDKLPSTL